MRVGYCLVNIPRMAATASRRGRPDERRSEQFRTPIASPVWLTRLPRRDAVATSASSIAPDPQASVVCVGAIPEKMRGIPARESPRKGALDHSQGWRARQRPEPLGAGSCFPEPCKGGRTITRGGGSAEGADAPPAGAAPRPCHGCRCRGRRLRSGFRPPSAPAPGNGIPFRAPACLRRPSRGSARRFAARFTPGYAPAPLAGASLGRNAALLHGGRALPDFMKSPCFPKWRFYRPSWGSIPKKLGQL